MMRPRICCESIAFAASVTGFDGHVTLFVPATAPRSKVEKLRTFPVEVREIGITYDDAHREAATFAERTGATLADPVESPAVAAGHGTLGLELPYPHPQSGIEIRGRLRRLPLVKQSHGLLQRGQFP